MMLFLKNKKKRVDLHILIVLFLPPFPIILQYSSIGYNAYKYEDLMLGLRCPPGSGSSDL